MSAAELGTLTVDQLVERFSEVHHRLYGFGLEGGAELVNLRASRAEACRRRGYLPHDRGRSDPAAAQTGSQTVWPGGRASRRPDLRARALSAGMRIPGHAIVEQYDATTVILPGHVAEVDPYLNLLIEPEASGRDDTVIPSRST